MGNSDTIEKSLKFEKRVLPDSLWFSGHFPNDPILPGIAQIAMVFDLLQHAEGYTLKILGLRRVRFKQIIKPHMQIEIAITTAKDDGTYAFQIFSQEELACKGTIITERS